MPRLKYWTVAPEAVKLIMSLNAYVEKSTIAASLRHLIKLRVSQINGCAYCVDLHSHEALRDGEKSQRLHCLMVWRETDLFTPRERAALAYAESITRIADTHVPDNVYDQVEQHFNELELVDLTLTISTMNAWNRMAISFRRPVAERCSTQAT
jgi:AhpD family alkylhydroperoxidase